MNAQNYVIFKGTRDGVTVLLDAKAPFDEICQQLEQKIEQAGKFFDNVKTSLAFSGRTLSESEEQTLLEILTQKTTMYLTFVKSNGDVTTFSDLTKKTLHDLHMTKYHTGSLRNGQVLEFDGSVVVLGDINPGAQIRATGNIIILGQLRGIAHAGCNGLSDAFIAAAYMAPVQLRIADIITLFPEENKHGEKSAEYAFVKDGQIFVMTLS